MATMDDAFLLFVHGVRRFLQVRRVEPNPIAQLPVMWNVCPLGCTSSKLPAVPSFPSQRDIKGRAARALAWDESILALYSLVIFLSLEAFV